ncbi:MAG TPA: hypothetical protein VH680_17375 [Gemmatimonadales bacterium]
MSASEQIRRAFLVFHVVLALALLWGGVHAALRLGPADRHALALGSIETVGAVAFLFPRTLRLGGTLLLLTLAGAFLVHTGRGEWQPDLLVYAAGVVLVTVHGSAYRHVPSAA